MNTASTDTNPISNNITNNSGVAAALVDPAAAPPLPVVLPQAEAEELAAHEATIKKGLETFVEVGDALAAIRDRRLYRAEFATFEDYCEERWAMTARQARRLRLASEVVRALRLDGIDGPPFALPATESQARPLAGLLPELQRAAWFEAVRTAPLGKVTARHVQSVVDRIKGTSRTASAAATVATLPDIVLRPDRRELRLQAVTEAIAAGRKAEAMLGAADSTVTAEASNLVHGWQKIFDHLKRMEDLQASRL